MSRYGLAKLAVLLVSVVVLLVMVACSSTDEDEPAARRLQPLLPRPQCPQPLLQRLRQSRRTSLAAAGY